MKLYEDIYNGGGTAPATNLVVSDELLLIVLGATLADQNKETFEKVANLLKKPFAFTYKQACTERNARIHTLLERSMLATILCSRRTIAKKILEYGQSRNFLMGI